MASFKGNKRQRELRRKRKKVEKQERLRIRREMKASGMDDEAIAAAMRLRSGEDEPDDEPAASGEQAETPDEGGADPVAAAAEPSPAETANEEESPDPGNNDPLGAADPA